MRIHFRPDESERILNAVKNYKNDNIIEKCENYILIKILRCLNKKITKDLYLPQIIELSDRDISELKSVLTFAYNINYSDGKYWIHIKQF